MPLYNSYEQAIQTLNDNKRTREASSSVANGSLWEDDHLAEQFSNSLLLPEDVCKYRNLSCSEMVLRIKANSIRTAKDCVAAAFMLEESRNQNLELLRRLKALEGKVKILSGEKEALKEEAIRMAEVNEEAMKSAREELNALERDAQNKIAISMLLGKFALLKELEKGLDLDYASERIKLENYLRGIGDDVGMAVDVVTMPHTTTKH